MRRPPPPTLPELQARLTGAGLRLTRQRIALAALLFAKGNRHLSAENLYEEAVAARVRVSLATVYNTLHQFTKAGVLREVAVDGSKTYFDTNTTDHHHFYFEDNHRVTDVPAAWTGAAQVAPPPEGYEIVRVDAVVRLCRVR